MSQGLAFAFSLFSGWIDLIFNQFTFVYLTDNDYFNVSIGWFIIGSIVISMLISSILNIPSRLRSDTYLSNRELNNRDYSRVQRYERAKK